MAAKPVFHQYTCCVSGKSLLTRIVPGVACFEYYHPSPASLLQPNVFAISQANGKKKMPPIYASLGELLGLKGPAPKAVYTSRVG